MFQVKTPLLVIDKQPSYGDEGNNTAITKDLGIIQLVASGVYRPGASLAAITEPPVSVLADISFQDNNFTFGRLFTLSLNNYFLHIQKSYVNLSWFYFYCFLLKHFLPYGIKSEKSYNLLKGSLSFVQSWNKEEKINFNVVYFITRLLKINGLVAGFDDCVLCEDRFKRDEVVYFHLNEQGLLCKSCAKKSSFLGYRGLESGYLSIDYLKLTPLKRNITLPSGLLRIQPEEREVLSLCSNTAEIEIVYTNIFSHSNINGQNILRARNFLLIFLASLL